MGIVSKDGVDRQIGPKNQNLMLWLVLIVTLILALRGPALLSRVWGNAGMVILARALIDVSDAPPAAAQAEMLFRRSMAYVSGNRSVWRGLGFALAIQAREDEAIDAWQTAGATAQEFIRRGEQEQEMEQYRQALKWYERAAQIEPDLGDAWYYMGLVYEETEQWAEALAAFQHGLSLPLVKVCQSDVYYKAGWLQFHEIEPPDLAAALASFDAAIERDQFGMESREIEAHSQRANVLRQLARGEEAILEYEWVIDRRPENYWDHVYAGMLYWQLDQDAERAESMLMVAISLMPDLKWAYRELAQIYREIDRKDEAIKLYEQVLILDPQDRLALDQLDELVALDEN